MNRRGFVSAIVVNALFLSGCTGENQVEQVPIWAENQATQPHNITVEWVDSTTGETLLTNEQEVAVGEEANMGYADPIRVDGEYEVSVSVAGNQEQTIISGGDLRSVRATVQSPDQISIDTV